MTNKQPILGIVPVRAGSTGLRNKALQLLDGEPLLLRTLHKVAPLVSQLVVSTNDATVAGIARLWGFHVEDRPHDLAGPDVPLAPVIAHAARHFDYGTVACFQTTVPFVAADTLADMIGRFRASGDDWWVAVAPCEGIHWMPPEKAARAEPIQPRVNRQQAGFAVPHRETGIQVMTASYARTGKGQGTLDATGPPSLGSYRIPPEEALDIDTPADLAAAQLRARRRHVHFYAKVSAAVGSGHLHRVLTLADALPAHHVTIGLEVGAPDWARTLRKQRGYENFDGVGRVPDLVVFDRLDTTQAEVAAWHTHGTKVATFEDEGTGRPYADLVVNELLHPEPQTRGRRYHNGPRYSVLRPEFASHPPHRKPNRLQKVLVTFGGTDPSGLNYRVAAALRKHHPDLAVRLALGPGVGTTGLDGVTEVRDGLMAEQMAWADLVITGQGRTQYEAAAMGVPTITLAANERESRHVRCPGHLHLGLHALVSDDQLVAVVDSLVARSDLRTEMADTARKAVDGRGTERVVAALDRLLSD